MDHKFKTNAKFIERSSRPRLLPQEETDERATRRGRRFPLSIGGLSATTGKVVREQFSGPALREKKWGGEGGFAGQVELDRMTTQLSRQYTQLWEKIVPPKQTKISLAIYATMPALRR